MSRSCCPLGTLLTCVCVCARVCVRGRGCPRCPTRPLTTVHCGPPTRFCGRAPPSVPHLQASPGAAHSQSDRSARCSISSGWTFRWLLLFPKCLHPTPRLENNFTRHPVLGWQITSFRDCEGFILEPSGEKSAAVSFLFPWKVVVSPRPRFPPVVASGVFRHAGVWCFRRHPLPAHTWPFGLGLRPVGFQPLPGATHLRMRVTADGWSLLLSFLGLGFRAARSLACVWFLLRPRRCIWKTTEMHSDLGWWFLHPESCSAGGRRLGRQLPAPLTQFPEWGPWKLGPPLQEASPLLPALANRVSQSGQRGPLGLMHSSSAASLASAHRVLEAPRPRQLGSVSRRKRHAWLEPVPRLERLWPRTPRSRIHSGRAVWSHFGALESSAPPSARSLPGGVP